MNPTSYLFESRFACTQTGIFSAEPCSKNAEETSIVLWITARVKNYNIPPSKPKSNISAPAKENTGFYANCEPNKQEVGFVFA
jgi:hypothetical protein